MESSNRTNASAVSFALAFIVKTPPPANQSRSPSPCCLMIVVALLMALLPLWDYGVHDGQYSSIGAMSTSYQTTGRTRQKARTRAALVAATRELLAEEVTPTVEQAAD